MKIIATTFSFSGLLLSAQAADWSHDFDALSNGTPWGADWQINSQVLSGSGSTSIFQNPNHTIGTIVGANAEGTVGRISATQGIDMTGSGIWATNSYNLGSDDLTMRVNWTPYTYFTLNSDTVNPATPVNQLFQIGLMTGTSGTLGDSTNDSFFLSGLENSAARTDLRFMPPSSAGITTEVLAADTTMSWKLSQEAGPNAAGSTAVTSGVFDIYDQLATSINTIDDKTGLPIIAWDEEDIQRSAYIFEITFANANATTMDVTVSVDEYHFYSDGNGDGTAPAEEFGSHLGSWTMNGVSHGLSDISAVRPALGHRIEDGANISVTASNYDLGTNVIPEPSGGALLLLAGLGILSRRRR